ncbi:MAG TPA: hypothetical protein VJC09_02345 [Candidatus Saccharimonadales bacterium]|nr:hypothetical protein [Candidatus Saccharimonadales bacterium]
MNSGIGEGMLPTPEEVKLREDGRKRTIELNRQLAASQRSKSTTDDMSLEIEIASESHGIIHPNGGLPDVGIAPVLDSSTVAGNELGVPLNLQTANIILHADPYRYPQFAVTQPLQVQPPETR